MFFLRNQKLFQAKKFLQILKSMAPFSTKVPCLKTSLDHIVLQKDSQELEAKTNEFCKQYIQFPAEERKEILKEIAQNYDIDREAAKKAAESFISLQDKEIEMQLKAAERLKTTLIPNYAQTFSRIRKLDGGVKFLVDLRADLLNMLPTTGLHDAATPHLKTMNNFLKEILLSSFNVGFLNLERITWDSSCHMLEKISQYEAVHPVRSWTDIKQRVGPYRRCYVFTHSSMPKEPIVVLHTALMKEISSNIASIVKHTKKYSEDRSCSSKIIHNQIEDPKIIQAAVFYSITSTQKGLHGIELGNQLIKKVVHEVQAEYPHIKQFSTLSPIPGFREWFLLQLRMTKNENSVVSSFFSEKERNTMKELFESSDVWNLLHQVIISNRWINDDKLKEFLKNPLMKTCAHYLINEKRRSNVLNSVAHFHLRNGAILWRLNWLGDISPRGLDNSCGIMVNYRYYIDETDCNSRNYTENHKVAVSDEVKELLTPAFNKSSL